MIKLFKNILKRRITSNDFVNEIRNRGGVVGERVSFIDPSSTHYDFNYPYAIKIGNDVTITPKVTILAHDYSYSVLNKVYGIMPQNFRPTQIGNNIFIGEGTTILMGTTIGDNVIIGAGAVVSGNIPCNTVWAGNPARQICTLDEYKEKHLNRYEESAVLLAQQIVDRFHRKPTYSEMKMFIGLFAPRSDEYKKYFERLNSNLQGVPENVWRVEQKYDDLEDFLKKNKIDF